MSVAWLAALAALLPLIYSSNVSTSGIQWSWERRLIRDLLDRYRQLGREARPLIHDHHKLDVYMGLRLVHLDIMEREQMLKTTVWMRIAWVDELLEWNPEDYGNVTSVVLSANKIWKPDIGLVNTAETETDERHVDFKVNHTGGIFWTPQRVLKSACLIDVTQYPFDKHTCNMWFQFITYPSTQVTLKPYTKSPMDLSTYLGEYKEAQEWQITHNNTDRVLTPRDEGVVLMYSRRVALKFTLSMKRVPGFKALLLTMPCLLLSLLTIVVFVLSPDRPDRHMLAMGLFGAFMLQLLLLTETAPPSAASIPTLGLYYGYNLLVIISSIFVSAIIVTISKFGESKVAVPKYVKLFFFRGLSRVVFMRSYALRALKLDEPVDDFADDPQHLNDDETTPCANELQKSNPSSPKDPTARLLTRMDKRLNRMDSVFVKMGYNRSTSGKIKENALIAQWKLIALMLDRVCVIIYLAVNLLLIALYFPRRQ